MSVPWGLMGVAGGVTAVSATTKMFNMDGGYLTERSITERHRLSSDNCHGMSEEKSIGEKTTDVEM